MERLRFKNMNLKKSLFLLIVLCLLAALFLAAAAWLFIDKLCADYYPGSGLVINMNGGMTWQEVAPRRQHIHNILVNVQLGLVMALPLAGLAAAGLLFYKIKLKTPLAMLLDGTERIQHKDLDFVLKYKSADELGQLCGAFEVMRSELMQSNCELWQRAEDRKRLNAAFAHDLRNPITVIKGAVTLLRADDEDNPAVQQLATHISRIEQYVDLMSSVQRLEDVTVCRQPVSGSALRQNIAETGKALAAGCKVDVLVEHLPDEVNLDSDLFCHVAENLLANAARFAAGRITVTLTADAEWLTLCVADDGAGYPAQLLMEGPQPFGRCGDAPEHFGMGLYICNVICGKHGGSLYLQNSRQGGAVAAAKFGIK